MMRTIYKGVITVKQVIKKLLMLAAVMTFFNVPVFAEETTTVDSTTVEEQLFISINSIDQINNQMIGSTMPNATVYVTVKYQTYEESYSINANINGDFNFPSDEMLNFGQVIHFDDAQEINFISTSNLSGQTITESIILNEIQKSEPIIHVNPTIITSQSTLASFAPVNVGDYYIVGNAAGYHIEVELSNGQYYMPINDDYDDFYIELPWKLSSHEQFKIFIYDLNNVLVETIDVVLNESIEDTSVPSMPIIEQKLISGQALISGQTTPNSLVLLSRRDETSVLFVSDANGFFYFELTDPLEENEWISISTISKNGISSNEKVESLIVLNGNRPNPPIIETAKNGTHLIKGKASPKASLILRRWINGEYQYTHVLANESGEYNFGLTRPLLTGEAITVFEVINAANNIILSPRASLIVE